MSDRMRRRTVLTMVLVVFTGTVGMAEQTRKSSSDEVTIAVSPMGDDRGPGTVEHPFRTLERAQNAVRRVNAEHDVRVQLDDGVYRIRRPLKFAAADGGRNGHYVEWAAVTDAHPVISGAISIRKWKLFDKDRDIYVADTPPGLDSRELWVADKLAQVARVEIQRSDVEFTSVGMLLRGAKYDWLGNVTQANRVELRVTGFFTERIAPASSISGRMLTMKQPGWDNNLWGYDTIEKPFHPSLSHLYLANSLAFLNAPGQWYIDPTRGKLYLRPPQKVAPQSLDVELPRLTVLMAVGGSLRNPVENMEFKGIRFSHSTWLGPSSNEGYASQQSGSFLSGHAAAFPADPIATCAQGCKAFESERSHWSQMPAAVQVSAAERITFDGDIFAHLGQYALGIGNDSDATLTRVGLGTGDITVERCVFTDLAGGAILAGGVRQDAHHPRDPRETNRDLIVQNNRIHSIGEEYQDNSAILSTYDEGASILHNDISDVPYDAIDIGYGWGINDAGGNPNYRFRMHGYDWPQNITYQTPTTYRDVVVANNRIHDAKELFHDGGAIYSLSASPGTLITENYIFNNHGRISLYLDEGSRYITVRRNVVDDQGGEWLNVNTVHSIFPIRVSFGNTAISNWHNGSTIGGQWTNYQDNLILDDHMIAGEAWPEEARQIMKNAGIEPSSGQVSYGAAQPDAEESGK